MGVKMRKMYRKVRDDVDLSNRVEEVGRRAAQEAEWNLMEGDIPDDFRDSEQVVLWSMALNARSGARSERYETTDEPTHLEGAKILHCQGQLLQNLAKELRVLEHAENWDHSKVLREFEGATDKYITPAYCTNRVTTDQLLELYTGGARAFFETYRTH